jgi:hypothetical protein
MEVLQKGKKHQVQLHGRSDLVTWQPKLLDAFKRNGVNISPWQPVPEGVAPIPGAMVLATPRVVVGGMFVKIRKALPKDLVEEAA